MFHGQSNVNENVTTVLLCQKCQYTAVGTIDGVKVVTAMTRLPDSYHVQVVQQSFGNKARPIVLALSNPDSVAECTAEEAYEWSEGAAVYGSGTTFPAFKTQNGDTYRPSQANNSLIFPGISNLSLNSCRRLFLATLIRRSWLQHWKAQRHETHVLLSIVSPLLRYQHFFAQLPGVFEINVPAQGPGHAWPILKSPRDFISISLSLHPGVGLGCIASGASAVTEDMMLAAAKAVARKLTSHESSQTSILPATNRLRYGVRQKRQSRLLANSDDSQLDYSDPGFNSHVIPLFVLTFIMDRSIRTAS